MKLRGTSLKFITQFTCSAKLQNKSLYYTLSGLDSSKYFLKYANLSIMFLPAEEKLKS